MISALLSQGLSLLLWTVALGLVWWHLGRRRRLPVALWIPGFVATLPVAFVLRGLLGEASFALPALACCATAPMPPGRPARFLVAALTAVALALYASALGFLEVDLYALGYRPGIGLAVVALAMLGAYRWLPILAWCWLAGIALYAAQLHPSPNLWDTLLCLPSVLLALAALARASTATASERRSPSDGGAAGCS